VGELVWFPARMANVLNDHKRQQVLALGRLGWPLRRIEEATGVRRETASAYLKAAGIGVRPPRGWGRQPPSNPANEAITDPALGNTPAEAAGRWPPPQRYSLRASACEPYREWITLAVRRRRDGFAIYRDLVDDHGFTASYSSVRRFVRGLRAEQASDPEAHPVIETAPGQEVQVDYGGDGPMVRHPESGKYRRMRLFVLTLGYSRKSVRLLSWRSSSEVWARLHEQSFRRLGGSVRTVVLDNLKEGVLTPDVYDPTLNPLYRDLLAHYGVVALPCRPRHPDRKGKVERSVDHAQRALRGLRFEHPDAAQAYLDRWEERWADTRIHGTTKRQVAAMFAEEKPHLQPLPLEPFRFYRFGSRTVHLDGAVEVEGAYYHAPPGWIGRELYVQWDSLHVRLLDPKMRTLLREYVCQKRGGRRQRDEDRSARTPPTTLALLARAARVGESIDLVCHQIYRHDGEAGVRRILGVLALAKKHGPEATHEACTAALELGVPTYRFVQRFLARRASAPPAPALKQIDPLIRQLTLYRDAIERLSQNEEKGDRG
jgi:transposase